MRLMICYIDKKSKKECYHDFKINEHHFVLIGKTKTTIIDNRKGQPNKTFYATNIMSSELIYDEAAYFKMQHGEPDENEA